MADFFAVDEYLTREFLLGLPADSNRYYDFKKGVGLHGDIWRKIVIEIGLGRTAVLRYYWKKSLELNKEYMPPLDININHGDMYIMSEKATGQNLKKAYNLGEIKAQPRACHRHPEIHSLLLIASGTLIIITL